jgi:hypothetical protein
MALLGPSGSGKTTALRAVAGFVRPASGRVFIGDRDVTGLPPYRRGIGMVVQQYALFPRVAFGGAKLKLDTGVRRGAPRRPWPRPGECSSHGVEIFEPDWTEIDKNLQSYVEDWENATGS